MDNLDEKIAKLREELKNGRTSQASRDTGTDRTDDDSALGTTFQDAGRAVSTLERVGPESQANDRKPASNRRSLKEKFVGGGRPSGRPGEDHGGVTLDSATTERDRSIGRLYTEDSSPARKPEPPQPNFSNEPQPRSAKKQGKQEAAPSKKKLLPDAHTYSKTEAEEKRESLQKALESDFDSLDEYLWLRMKRAGIDTKDEQPIWSDIDEEETAALVRLLLRGAQQNELLAVAVDGIIDSADYVSVATVFAPRVKRTATIMKETRQPRQPRQKRTDAV